MKSKSSKQSNKEACHVCGKLCAPNMLKVHLRRHTDLVLHDCHVCNRRFISEKTLNVHMQIHLAKFPCQVCGKKYVSEHLLKNHVCAEKPRNHKCDECHKAFLSQQDLIRHIRIHTNEKPYPCEECGRRFNQKSARDSHKRLVHGPKYPKLIRIKEKNHVCEYCKKAFKTNHDLKRHVRMHTKEKPYKCNYCDKSFTQSSNRNLHVKQHLKDPDTPPQKPEKKYVCKICFTAFGYKSHLDRHSKLHTGERHFVCSICQKGFIQRWQMTRHMNSQHSSEKKHKCDKCGKAFKHKLGLQLHKTTHSKPNITCEGCNKSFAYKSGYERHFDIVHRKLKPYKCAICDKEFSLSSTLKSHYISHTKQKQKEKLKFEKLNTAPCDEYHSEISKDCNVYIGDICEETCTDATALEKHFSQAADSANHNCMSLNIVDVAKNEIAFSCQTCNKKFLCVDELEKHSCILVKSFKSNFDHKIKVESEGQNILSPEHSTLHTPIENRHFVHKCQICCEIFSNHSSLKEHINTHTNVMESVIKTESINVCSYEDKNAGSSSDLLKEENLYICHVCKINFCKAVNLEQHHIEFMQKKSSCCMCNQEFKALDKLLEHHVLHEDVFENFTECVDTKPHLCKVCEVAFQTELLLNDHTRKFTDEKIECCCCHQVFGSKIDLVEHHLIHNNSRTEKPLICFISNSNT